MSKAVEFEINNKKVKVIETSSPEEVLDTLNKFVNNVTVRSTRFVGFESLVKFPDNDSRKPIVALCDGDSCLVCPLTRSCQGAVIYLANFLRHPRFIFVGSGIKSSLKLLEKDYNIYFKNVVELGPLVAPMVQVPSSPKITIDLSSDWRPPLTHDETGLIASMAYSYYDIGCKKLGNIVPSTMEGDLYFKLTGQMM